MYHFNLGIRRGYFRHLFSGNFRLIEDIAQPNVALLHFHEKVLLLNAEQRPGQHFIKAIGAELGKEVGLSGADNISNSRDYYALPNQSLSTVETLVRSKEVGRYEVGLEIMSPVRISSFSKRALREAKAVAEASSASKLELDRKLQKIKDDDIKVRSSFTEVQERYIKRILKSHKSEVTDLNDSLANSEEKLRECEAELLRVREINDIIVNKQQRDFDSMYTYGLQRSTILTDGWHKLNPTMCSHLFGFLTFQE